MTLRIDTDISSVMGTGDSDAFSASLKTVLDAASVLSGNSWTYTVTWTGSTGSYETAGTGLGDP